MVHGGSRTIGGTAGPPHHATQGIITSSRTTLRGTKLSRVFAAVVVGRSDTPRTERMFAKAIRIDTTREAWYVDNMKKQMKYALTIVAATCATLAAVLIVAACASFGKLTPAARAVADINACRVAVVARYTGDVLDASEVVREVVMQRTDLTSTLLRLGVPVATVEPAVREFLNCDPEMAAPPVAPAILQRIVAPPPAYGNKVL